MWGLLVPVAAAETVGVREAEAAWWPIYGDVAPGAPRAVDALSWWLARYAETGSARVRVVRVLHLAQLRDDERTAEKAWLLAREPLHVLESGRGARALRRLEDEPPVEPAYGGDEGWFGQVGFVGGATAATGAPVGLASGASAMVGPSVGRLLVGAGVTATVDRAGTDERQASLRGELLVARGHDGVLLWGGLGYGGGRLHQLVQLEVTTDGEQPWLFLALRAEVEESLRAPEVGGRALVLIGGKIGRTPE